MSTMEDTQLKSITEQLAKLRNHKKEILKSLMVSKGESASRKEKTLEEINNTMYRLNRAMDNILSK